MIYFKTLAGLRTFISMELVDKEKSEYNFLKPEKEKLVLKYSSVSFNKVEDIIEELEKQGYIFRFKREIKPWESKLKDVGFIFLHSKLIADLRQQDVLSDTLKNDRLLTINQVADFLNITRPTVYNKIKEGVFPVVNLFGQKRIQLKDILDYIQKNKK